MPESPTGSKTMKELLDYYERKFGPYVEGDTASDRVELEMRFTEQELGVRDLRGY